MRDSVPLGPCWVRSPRRRLMGDQTGRRTCVNIMDHTSFWAGDRVAYVVEATDHCDRDAMGYRITDQPPTAQTAIDTLEQAVAARAGEYLGELEIRTAGGPQFVAHRFTATVRRLGFTQTVTPKRSPQYNPFAAAILGAFEGRMRLPERLVVLRRRRVDDRRVVSQVPPPPRADCAWRPGPDGVPGQATPGTRGMICPEPWGSHQ